mmetsp:Transcript_15299/g.34762  ORF Transcript_15299/g.34762 Transcript_15299/m.34762 type:complete len:661 (-) Transcript_15299:115-2097(-)
MRISAIIAGGALAEQVTPLAKVTHMLQEMLSKTAKEKHEDVVAFSTFKQWCDDTNGEKHRAIADENQLIEKLSADIEKGTASIGHLGRELERLGEDLASFKGDLKAAAGIRKKEHEEFKASRKDLTESVDAIERAIAIVRSKLGSKKQAGGDDDALLQLAGLKRIPLSSYHALQAFLQGGAQGAPEVAAYESQSSGVVEILEELRHKFEDERHQLEKEEMNNKFGFEQTQQGLSDSIEQAESELSTKTGDKQKAQQRKASNEKDLTKTQEALKADSEYLQDTTNECMSKAQAYENRQVTRAGEIEAIEKAMEILGSSAVAGTADKHLPKLLQLSRKGHSFAQLRSAVKNDSGVQKVVDFLQAEAKKLGSRTLEVAAIKDSEDPFKKVKKMIEDLITKLMDEANAEATHKGWCDTELGTNKHTRDEKTTTVDKLTAEVDERSSRSDKLRARLSSLNTGVSDLVGAVSTATAARNEEKIKNKQTIEEAKEAQKAVSQALEVLKEFYAKNSENADLMQQPATFDSPEKGQQSSATGVIGMLEVILSDFARLETETREDEETAESEHEKFVDESKEDQSVKELDIENYTGELERNEANLHDAKNELSDEQSELDTALGYYEELKSECIKQPISYEERVAARKAEIESLRNALQMLGGESSILEG